MPFRCKCGRTFEKLDTFGSHTSGCAPFHHRRISSSDVLPMSTKSSAATTEQKVAEEKQHNKKRLSIQTDPTLSYFNQRFIMLSPTSSAFDQQDSCSSPPRSAPIFDGYKGFMMPTALSIQNTFEGVNRRRSMSYSAASLNTASGSAVGGGNTVGADSANAAEFK
jgi:hypothetical protein